MEEISGKPQLMGDIAVSTPTYCANCTSTVESLAFTMRRVEANSAQNSAPGWGFAYQSISKYPKTDTPLP